MSMVPTREAGQQGTSALRVPEHFQEDRRTLGAFQWLRSEAVVFVADEEDVLESFCHLTHTERTVLDLVAQGKLNKQIAHLCGMAPGTVKAHVTAILRKLKVRSRTQAAVRYAVLTDRMRYDR